MSREYAEVTFYNSFTSHGFFLFQIKMKRKTQNLFLFFEENEVQTIIDNKLVLRYANRCIIDEQAEFEVCL